ncbi:GMC oxidoreductase [Laccaria amethystina LaAM-08-1]|uniref:GMC oxidoreductase n=1 Tax=Laccaria amethystina LaAM-08-1 TaxID=1095629 RepID=A0A0C9XJK1_9AGAR|nr:GMC oxidoreductase [Laccaria amethystina LaAM-08-1]
MSNPSFFLPSVRLPGLNASICPRRLIRRQPDVHRPSKRSQVSVWSKLISDDTWSWDNPPISSVESTAGMQFKTSSRGSDGPLQATYPAYMVPITTNRLPTLNSTGIPASSNAYNGINTGGFFATSAINPFN